MLAPRQLFRIRLARDLASSGKSELLSRAGYVQRATTCNITIQAKVVTYSWVSLYGPSTSSQSPNHDRPAELRRPGAVSVEQSSGSSTETRDDTAPFKQQLNDVCLEVRGADYQNCSVLYCVLKLCTVISTLR